MRSSIKVKVAQVESLVKDLSSVVNVAVVSLNGVSASQLKMIKNSLNDSKIIVKSKNILRRSLIKAGKGLEKLVPHLKGSCGLLLSSNDIFRVSVKLSKLRTPAFIKAGVTATNDVLLDEGPTPFMPGELMTQLTDLGVKVSPKGGKITILEPAVIVKAGEVVSAIVADLLFKLNVKPVNVGLDLIAALDDGKLFTGDELIVDVDSIINDLLSAHSGAVNLSFNAGIVNEFTIKQLLSKAFNQARNLMIEAGIITNDNISDLMLTAKTKALVLASTINLEVKE